MEILTNCLNDTEFKLQKPYIGIRVFRSFHKNDRSDISANVAHMD